MNTFASVLVTHYFGDFVCQSREIAENKSKSVKVLSKHVGIYAGWMLLAAACDAYIFRDTRIMMELYVAFVGINAVLHFITDFITSRMSAAAYKAGNMKLFWNIIGADQMIHTICLYLTWFALGFPA